MLLDILYSLCRPRKLEQNRVLLLRSFVSLWPWIDVLWALCKTGSNAYLTIISECKYLIWRTGREFNFCMHFVLKVHMAIFHRLSISSLLTGLRCIGCFIGCKASVKEVLTCKSFHFLAYLPVWLVLLFLYSNATALIMCKFAVYCSVILVHLLI